MQTRHVLTFNWHDPYLYMFSKTGFRVSVGDWMHRADGTTGWDMQKRPLPENLTLLKHPAEVAARLKQGAFDAAICHTLQDLSFIAPFDVPTIYLTHNALQNDGLNDARTMAKLKGEVASFLKARGGVFAAISPMKLKSWGLDGFVVRPGIDLDDYAGYTGDLAAALSVGNLFVERDHMLGYRYLKEMLNGVPHHLIGENPRLPESRKAANWEDLKSLFRHHRVYVNATVEAFEDGYNLGMLEAMATGMPVVCRANATSPIRDGENGYLSADTGYLRHRVLALLGDVALARKLGEAARATVADQFSVSAFVSAWHEIVEASIARAGRRGHATAVQDASPAKTRGPAVQVRATSGETSRGERRLKVLVGQVSNPIGIGRYYVDAFRKGHDVMTCGPVIDADELAQWRRAEAQHAFKSMASAEVDKLDLIGRLAAPCDIPMPRGQVDLGEALDRLPGGWRPDLFVWVDSATGFLPQGLEKLDCPTACLMGDTHTGQMGWRLDYARLFSHVFVMFARQHMAHFEKAGCARVHWLPGACDPAVHGRVASAKSYDIGFSGQTHRQWHPHRVRLLQRLIDAGFDVRVESKILEDMALFFSRSRLVFNRSLNGDVNMRVFEALCSGSLLLTDRLPEETGLDTLFRDREHLVLYDDDLLEELAQYYLAHESEREAIALAGREAVLAGHTYAHRADQIAEVVFGEGIAPCVRPVDGGRSTVSAGMRTRGKEAPHFASCGAGSLETAVTELAAYTGEDGAAVHAKLDGAGAALTREWRAQTRRSADQIDAFYKETPHYLYDLTQFNYSPMYTGWRGAIYNLCQQMSDGAEALRVLDYGGGIGTTLLSLSDLPNVALTYADLPGKTFDYARWRFERRGLAVEAVALAGEDALAGRQFDAIVCLDVIEHLVDPEKAVRALIDMLRPGGLLILTVTFYAPEPDMMHLNLDRYTNEGFYEIVGKMGMQALTSFSPRVFQKPVGRISGSNAEGKTRSDSGGVRAFLQAQSGPIRLNLGCGEDRREGYINVDAFVPSADLQTDIFDLPLDEGVVDEIFSSHMLEHLGKYEVPEVLKAWRRVLKPGGVLRLNLPDLEWAMNQWLRAPETHRWGWSLDAIYGLQTHPGEYHKTGFTAARIEALLEAAGFAQICVSWVWSHGLRCLWVDARRPGDEKSPTSAVSVALDKFASQFTLDLSDLSPYVSQDAEAFLQGDWQVGRVNLQRLPMDAADYTVSVSLKRGERQMVLDGIQILGGQQPQAFFPKYLTALSEEVRLRLSKAIGQTLRQTWADPAYRDSKFVTAQFGPQGDMGLTWTGERVVPGQTDYALYIPHMKRYLLAEQFASGARVLDAGCGAGYGARRLAQAAARVDAVDVDAESIAFARRTYGSDRMTWQVADLRTFTPEAGAYDLVTSFEVIEHFRAEDIPAYLDRISRALKPGGTALISTPNKRVAEQWQNPHHLCEMTREEFRRRLKTAFGEVTLLGQAPWSTQVELPGQCAISKRVTDDDDMYVAVCRKPIVRTPESASGTARVSIVMPLFNKADYTRACLNGLESARGGVPYEVILVDNGSTDDTGALLDAVAGQAGYRVIRNDENLGFARGNNAGAQCARGAYLLFLNNDTIPHAGFLDAMAAELDADAQVGIVGAKLLYPDTGRIQHAGLALINGVPDHVYRHAPADAPEVCVARDLDMVTGACLMIRKELFDRLGGFDAGYVNGVEDVDLCLRVRDLGYRVRYCPQAVVDHYEGTSEGRYQHVRPNLELFVKRWKGRFDAQGMFVPQGQTTPTATQVLAAGAHNMLAPVAAKARLRGVWEGTQFVYHSLSLVNMALSAELIKAGCELRLVPYEPATFGPEVDPERYDALAERMNAELTGPAQFHVRHTWPPDFSAPHEGHWIMIQPWEFGRIPKAWVQPIQDGVDEVWVPSTFARQCYLDSGVDADRVQVIPNGVRTDVFRPDVEPLALETQKAFKFLFVGGAIFRKGIDVLLDVYRKTFSRRDDVSLVIKTMGDASFYKGQTAVEAIKRMQADPDAPEILHVTGDLTDAEMAGLYAACDCLVHPYRGEGFGMPVAEAMACGLPVIVTRGGACDDFCDSERAYFVAARRREIAFEMETAGPAWLLEPDPEALAAQMRAVVADPEAAQAKGRCGCAYVREHLTWTRAAEKALARLEAVQANPIRRLTQRTGEAPNVDVFVLADGAGGPPEGVTRFTDAPVHVVAGGAGWAAALNAGWLQSAGDYVAIVRGDVVATAGWLDRLLAYLEADASLALVVPRLPVGPDGQVARATYQSTKRELQRFAKRLSQREPGACVDVQYPSGVCAVIRRDVLQRFCGFDGSFATPAFFDDLCRRCRQVGMRVVCARDVFVHCDEVPASEDEARERRAVAHLETGDSHRANGETEAALGCYRASLSDKPDYLETTLIYSAVLLEQNRAGEAAEVFERMVERHPDSSRLHNFLGRCLFLTGDRDRSRVEFERAIALDADFGEAYSNLGVLLWESGHLDAALEKMNRAAELAPQSPDVIYNIGMIYAQLGQGKQAAEVLQHYLTMTPTDLHARTYLAVLLLENGAQYDGMVELERVLKADPENAEALDVLSQLKTAADAIEDEEN